MRFIHWLIEAIKSLFTSDFGKTVETATIAATKYTFIDPSKENSSDCLEEFTEVSLTI